jgi:hypothetical protein
MGPDDAFYKPLHLGDGRHWQRRTTVPKRGLHQWNSEIEPKSTNGCISLLTVASWERCHFGAWGTVEDNELVCTC